MYGLTPYGLTPNGAFYRKAVSQGQASQNYQITVPAAQHAAIASQVSVAVRSALAVDSVLQPVALQAVVVNQVSTVAVDEGSQSANQATPAIHATSLVVVPGASGGALAQTVSIGLSSPNSQPVVVQSLMQQSIQNTVSVILVQASTVEPASQFYEASALNITSLQSAQIASAIQLSLMGQVNVSVRNDPTLVVAPVDINPRHISISHSTERLRINRTSEIYTTKLTTLRYQLTRG